MCQHYWGHTEVCSKVVADRKRRRGVQQWKDGKHNFNPSHEIFFLFAFVAQPYHPSQAEPNITLVL
jgi:hypothetical protein